MARNTKETIPGWMRRAVLERDNYRCRYCASTDSGNTDWHMDHVYPESKGGETSVANLVTACGPCNTRKHATVGMWPIHIDEMGLHTQIAENKRAWKNLHAIKTAVYSVGLLIVGILPFYQAETHGLNSDVYHAFMFMGALIYGFSSGIRFAGWRTRQ